MNKALALALILGLAACGEEPKPAAAKPEPPKPVAQPAVTPAAAPQAAATEVPKADPNKELAGRVKRAMEEGKLDGIDVTASDGVVTLWGTTGSAGERSRAAQIAGKVDGVKSVENKLQVVKGS